MFSPSSQLQGGANGKIRKTWRLFHATDFQSLMYPCFTFCYILGIFPYKIKASTIEISQPRYILSTIVICIYVICLLIILYMIDICGSTIIKFKGVPGVPRILERNCYYILSSFIAVVTYILSGPRMRLLQTIMKISSKLPPKSYQKLSRLIHTKDILGFVFLIMESPIYFPMNIPTILKIFIIYISLLMFEMDMLYVNCVCVLSACFKRINDSLGHMRDLIIDDKVYHLGQMCYKQRSSFLLIELKALKKQHLLISDAVNMLNMIFSLQLIATIIITFIEITFELYFHILFWQKGISMINMDDYIYNAYLMLCLTYHFAKIMLIVWACETGKNQAAQIGTTVHDVLNSSGDNQIKGEIKSNEFKIMFSNSLFNYFTIKLQLQLFSLQILHRNNTFSTKILTVDARLLTTIVSNISTYLLILMQFLNMTYLCDKETATNITQTI